MKFNTNKLAWLSIVAAALCLAPVSQATSLAPGGSDSSPLIANPSLAPTGPALGNISGSFSSPSWVGTYTETVYKNVAGTLDFVYNFSVATTAPGEAVYTMSVSSYANFLTDVWTSGAGVTPDSATRSHGTGITVNFSFDPNGVEAGTNSDTLIVATNATAFSTGNISFIDSYTDTVAGLDPTTAPAAPEPSSMLLFGTGLSGVAAILRRRRKPIQ